MYCSLPGSSVHGIFQAKVLEFPFPSPGHLPDPGIAPRSSTLQADASLSEPPGKPFTDPCLGQNWVKKNNVNIFKEEFKKHVGDKLT